jgi:preprotein translocase subunit SecF
MIKYRKYFYTLSLILVGGSVIALAIFGLRFGIDFTGGSTLEVLFTDSRPTHEAVRDALADFKLGEIVIQDSADRGMILRFREVNETVHQNIVTKVKTLGELNERRFEAIGPVIGEEMKQKTFWAIGLAILLMLFYVAWAFRRVSFPVGSWVYGVIAVITLCHDVLITIGLFALLGHFAGVEVGVAYVAALLTIWGYSVNDTIVIFDRIRENVLRQGSSFDFGEVIDKSVRQTFVRSLNTSLTVLFALLAIFFFGGETVRYFVLALITGVIVGSYSSLFIASPLLFSWYMLKMRRRGRR